MQREQRYVVLKLKDIDAYLELWERDALAAMLQKINYYRAEEGKEDLECVVIEHDWSCYEDAWMLVEREEHERKKLEAHSED